MLQSCNAAILQCCILCISSSDLALCRLLHGACPTSRVVRYTLLHVARCMFHVACCTLHVAPLLAALGFMLYTRCVRRGADLRTAASVEPTRAAHRTLCVRLGFVSAPLRLPPVFLSLSSQCVPNGPLSIYLWRWTSGSASMRLHRYVRLHGDNDEHR
jgi:hypothetical protein